jgi:hypothetical protein
VDYADFVKFILVQFAYFLNPDMRMRAFVGTQGGFTAIRARSIAGKSHPSALSLALYHAPHAQFEKAIQGRLRYVLHGPLLIEIKKITGAVQVCVSIFGRPLAQI